MILMAPPLMSQVCPLINAASMLGQKAKLGFVAAAKYTVEKDDDVIWNSPNEKYDHFRNFSYHTQ